MHKEVRTYTKGLRGYYHSLGLNLFFIISITLIVISAIQAIPVDGGGQIGIMANPLSIGDRSFYINDVDPWGDISTGTTSTASPLYPLLLRSYSSIVGLAGFSSTTPAWNLCAIAITWATSLATLLMLKRIAHTTFNQGAGDKAAIIYSLCPYTYYYILSGGLTAIFLCTFTAYTLLIIRSASLIQKEKALSAISWIGQASIATLTVLLRPSGLPIIAIMQLGITLYIAIKKVHKGNRCTKLRLESDVKRSLYCLLACAIIAISAIVPSRVYINDSLRAYQVESGTHLGVERSQIKGIVSDLHSSGEVANSLAGGAILAGWRISDAFLGINDARDTYTTIPSRSQAVGVIARGLTAIFFLLPMSYAALAAAYVYREEIVRSGFCIPLTAMVVTLSYSLLGFPMSRYYIMVWTPAACLAGAFWHTLEKFRKRL